MKKKIKKILVASLSVAILATMATIPSVASAATSTQLAGKDRYETALKIVQDGWTKSDNVIIARGDVLADALAAAPLAYAKEKAPILLTKTNEIPTGVLEELKALEVKNVYIVGGVGAVSKEVADELGKDFTISRLEGKDRVETSLKVANEAFGTSPSEVVIANGISYVDALSVSSIAASKGMPILLVNKNKLSEEQTTYIEGKTVYAVGGTGVLNEEIVSSTNAIRLSGLNRYETNASILDAFYQDYSKIYVAKGTNENLVDSLAGSALAALQNNPVILVDGNNKINTKLKATIKIKIIDNSIVIRLGGTVTDAAVEALRSQELPVENPTTTISNLQELQAYLETNFSELHTSIGVAKFTFNIYENESSYEAYDYWIMVEYDYNFFEGAMSSIKYTSVQKDTLRSELKNFQKKIGTTIISAMPNKKVYGGYFNSWYRYPTLHLDLQIRSYYSWMNYEEVFTSDINQIYENAKPSTFRWYSFIDDDL